MKQPYNSRGARSGQRGQVVPIVALAAIVLFTSAAIAVDLSLQTHQRRSLQNVGDAAALAAARDLPTSVTIGDQKAAVTDALTVIGTNYSFPSGWYGGSLPANGCSASGYCVSFNYVFNGDTYSVAVNTPPRLTQNPVYKDVHYAEVALHKTTRNYLGGIVGIGTSNEGASSVALHTGPGTLFGFALFSNIVVATGNQPEIIQGDVYAARYVQPQDSSASLCASDYPNNGGPGYLILGAPQFGDSTGTYDAQTNPGQHDTPQDSSNSNPVISQSTCTTANMGGGHVFQTGHPTSDATCPSISGTDPNTGGPAALAFNSGSAACEIIPALGPPVMNPPSTSGAGVNAVSVPSNTTWNAATHPTTPGIYMVQHSNTCLTKNKCDDLTIDTKNGPFSLNNITIYLTAGASVGFSRGTTVTLTPYAPTGTSNPNDGKFAIYAVSTSANQAPELDITGTGTVFDAKTGAIYMPTGTVSETSNGALKLESGQAIVNNWQVQTGNHPNPEITYGGNNNPSIAEVLQLVQ